MSLRKIFALITMILLVLLIVNMFLPFLEAGRESISFWDYLDQNGAQVGCFLVLGELIFGIVICILTICNVLKDYKYSLFSIGYIMTYSVVLFSSLGDYQREYLSISFYLGILCSFVAMILVFVGNALSNEKKQNNTMMYGQNYGSLPVAGYDPNTGAPIYAKPAGFDPNTGAPIYR